MRSTSTSPSAAGCVLQFPTVICPRAGRGDAIRQRGGLAPGQLLLAIIERDAIRLICGVSVNEPSQLAIRLLQVLQRLSGGYGY